MRNNGVEVRGKGSTSFDYQSKSSFKVFASEETSLTGVEVLIILEE